MKVKEGNVVEVFKRNDGDQYGGWFPATLLFVNGRKYTVRYELEMAPEGNPIVEVVNEENVRPPPPPENSRERWIVGDVAEVFDQDSWRVGKIAKVLKNGCVVMKLFGSVQLKEFHSSSLRVQQTWWNNGWIVADKVHGDQDVNDYTKSVILFNNGPRDSLAGEDYSVKRSKQNCLDYSCRTTMKRNLSSYYGLEPDNIGEGTCKRRKGSFNGSHHLDRKLLPTKVDAVSFPKYLVAEKFLHKSREGSKTKKSYLRENRSYTSNQIVNNQAGYSFSEPLQFSDENIESSVASCSANQFHGYTSDKNRYHSKNTDINLLDDAMSSCNNANDTRSMSAEELAASIHELELHAYQSTMQALYASGPMSWEQESLLTNLRMCLNISNEEHLLHLRHLLSV